VHSPLREPVDATRSEQSGLRVRPRPAFADVADEELVGRARSGDRWAEDALYRKHVQAVAGVVTRLLRSQQDVDDVVQDAFLTALEKIDRLRDPAAFRSWLMSIAVVRVRRVIRRRRLQRMLGLDRGTDEATLDALADASAPADVRMDLALIDRVLRELPTEQRIAWSLRYGEGHRPDDVAAECGCSPATVKRRIAAAHRRIEAVVRIGEVDDA